MADDFSVAPVDATFGAVVTRLDLRRLDEAAFAALYRTWLEYGLLIFPAQHLSGNEQQTFARRFGDLVPGLEAAEISNVLPDGRLRQAPDDDMMKIIRGNMQWHQDNTYMPLQAKGAVFSARKLPTAQGATAFADMRAAHDALDESVQQYIGDKAAHHSLAYSQARMGEATKQEDSEYMGYGLDVAEAPLRPLVKTHPETGRKALAVGRHAYGIPGISEDESSRLIADLIDFAVSDAARVHEHSWSAGDVILWDNRCLMHKACPWDFSQARIMVHSRIAGDPETEAALQESA